VAGWSCTDWSTANLPNVRIRDLLTATPATA
jgi:hypothetical protein